MIDLREEIAMMFDACAPEPWVLVEQYYNRRRHQRAGLWFPAYRWSRDHYRKKWNESTERCLGRAKVGGRCRLMAVKGFSYCARHMN